MSLFRRTPALLDNGRLFVELSSIASMPQHGTLSVPGFERNSFCMPSQRFELPLATRLPQWLVSLLRRNLVCCFVGNMSSTFELHQSSTAVRARAVRLLTARLPDLFDVPLWGAVY